MSIWKQQRQHREQLQSGRLATASRMRTIARLRDDRQPVVSLLLKLFPFYLLGKSPPPTFTREWDKFVTRNRGRHVAKWGSGSSTLRGKCRFAPKCPYRLSHLGDASRHLGRSPFRAEGPLSCEAAGVPLPRTSRLDLGTDRHVPHCGRDGARPSLARNKLLPCVPWFLHSSTVESRFNRNRA